ncbi:MAG: hypothetical protein ACYC8T_22555 [Myxococcaceae bacterium]
MRRIAIGSILALVVGAVLAPACGGGNVVITGGGDGGPHGGGGGGAGGGGGGAGGGGGGAPDAGDGCPEEAKTVYVVDTDGTFSSFDPKLKQFHDVGTLSCPAQAGANPFSMAVDRTATALVLYDSGELFKVNTLSLACTKTSFDSGAGHGFGKFGMGFSTDTAGGTTDTLFISGGATVGTTSSLARLNATTFAPTPVGTVNGWPELTGTGDAKLWGFMPEASGSTPVVVQLSKADASTVKTWSAPSLQGEPLAWAFAFWGGRFWIFLKRTGDSSTFVYAMDASTGALSTALSNTGRTIVGAGVSTCAPVDIN